MFILSNQMDYIFWKYPGTGTRNTEDYEWAQEINKDTINLILTNSSLLFSLSTRLNITKDRLTKILIILFLELN